MKTTAIHLYRFTPFLSILAAVVLSGCAPAYMDAPEAQPQVPQAAPLQQQREQQQQEHQQQQEYRQQQQEYQQQQAYQQPSYQAPPSQPRYVDVPPALDPIEERQAAVMPEPMPDPVPQAKPVYEYRAPVRKPAVTYIPDAPKAEAPVRRERPVVKPAPVPVQEMSRPVPPKPEPVKRQSSTQIASVPETKPFWDQGKVEVEVLDMQKPSRPAVSTSVSTSSSGSSSSAADSSDSSSGSTTLSGTNSSPAVIILMKQANNELVAGKSDRAAATLERALRISPSDASLWLRLAEVNAQQGNKQQAATMARKAMTLAPGDTTIARRSQRLLN